MPTVSDAQARLAQAYAIWQEANPEPQGELNYTNAFTLLVAVVLSAQATDVGVNKATAQLFVDADTPEAMRALGVEGLIPYISSIGLYKNKAKFVIGLCEILLEKHNGEVPNDEAALVALPGVGRKTANVVRNIAFGVPTLAVDTHIFRVGNRTGFAPGANVDEVEKAFLANTPEQFLLHAHHWLILHGRYVCKARKPLCATCTIHHLCDTPAKGTSAHTRARALVRRVGNVAF